MDIQSYSLGLIGYPLDHSLSPTLHSIALRVSGLSGHYHLYAVPPDPAGYKSLERLLAQMRGGEIQGLNVTIPHKSMVIPYLDDLTPVARTIGAVNTIFREGDQLVGDNTDAPAFMADLKRFLGGSNRYKAVDAPTVLILGAGGAARAVCYALLEAGWPVWIASRRLDQAQTLAQDLQSGFENKHYGSITPMSLSLDHLQQIATLVTLIVNATPLGMAPDTDSSPWPEALPLPSQAAVYDLVYNPSRTRLTRQAHAAGLRSTTGLGMLIEQAALAFERWTGYDIPRRVFSDLAPP